MNQQSGYVTFREEQNFRRVWWVMLLMLGMAAMMWWGLIEQIVLGQPWGNNPGPDWMVWLSWLLFGVGMPIFFLWIKLDVSVTTNHIQIRYKPFANRSIAYTDIDRIQARTYSPIKEYAGWGVKGWSSKKIAYNVSGNQGVEIFLADGRTIMIGSQKPQKLAAAIEAQLQNQRRQPSHNH